MAILVTGGAGYIGSHTCVELLERGYEVVVVDNLYNSSEVALERVQEITGKTLKFYKGDILNREDLEPIFENEEIEAVINFAGLKAVGESVEKPWEYYHNNITGTLILCDVMMPVKDGFECCKEVKEGLDTCHIPFIMLTAKVEDEDIVKGLELGADDYIVKPFEPKELVARVKAVLRRYEPKQEEDKNILKFGELEINLSNYSVLYHGKSLDFPPKEFELLSFLAQHPNRVFTREQLLDRIWGYEYVGDTRTVDVHVKRIREKLNSEDEWGIRTVWSVGYKFGQK